MLLKRCKIEKVSGPIDGAGGLKLALDVVDVIDHKFNAPGVRARRGGGCCGCKVLAKELADGAHLG